MMSKIETITRLCMLASKVRSKMYDDQIPADCFCTDRQDFQMSEEVIEFIEKAVEKAL